MFALLFLYLLSFVTSFYLQNTAIFHIEIQKYTQLNRMGLAEKRTSGAYDVLTFYRSMLGIQNMEVLVLQACAMTQAVIVGCLGCYAVYGNMCDNMQVCREIKEGGVDPDDEEYVWAFLPNSEGKMGEVFSGATSSLTDLASIRQGDFGRGLIVNSTISPTDMIPDVGLAISFTYRKPSKNMLGCGYEQVVFYSKAQ